MDVVLTTFEQSDDARTEQGPGGRTIRIKILRASDSAFQNALNQTCHTVSCNN